LSGEVRHVRLRSMFVYRRFDGWVGFWGRPTSFMYGLGREIEVSQKAMWMEEAREKNQ
jgi:hypothetical protein